MLALILKRTEVDGDSLSVRVLNAEGEIQQLKFPGVLKSKKRSSYNITPGTAWDFTLQGNAHKVRVPRESLFVSSPFGPSPSYNDLQLIHEMLAPVLQLPDGDTYKAIFIFLFEVLKRWCQMDIDEKEHAASKFILLLFKLAGFYHSEKVCYKCGTKNFTGGSYHLQQGYLCSQCQQHHLTSDIQKLLGAWLSDLEIENSTKKLPRESHARARKIVTETLYQLHH